MEPYLGLGHNEPGGFFWPNLPASHTFVGGVSFLARTDPLQSSPFLPSVHFAVKRGREGKGTRQIWRALLRYCHRLFSVPELFLPTAVFLLPCFRREVVGQSKSPAVVPASKDVSYRPPGTQENLLNGVSISLPENSLGLIFGRSGSGKTTLLQLIAGLSKPTSGSIYVQRYGNDGKPNQSPEQLTPERVGIVFQFPERYFVADNVLEEVTFGWPRQRGGLQLKELLASRLHRAITSVGLHGISLDKDPQSLSGGYKRRLALAIQLVQFPDLLILDEPLAGLDWKARADVVKLLKQLKKELTLLVVSHDLRELAGLVDRSWKMEMGGVLKEEPLPVY
ncbi:ABC transporter I family member 11, chloroplastic isoform X2 [Diospyros lotus]|uniref:ABC transporter I family member 11, chloroplastic isoform X2 n=1 Tax=Diospyros lotus TaxID=55363 RepID=UPI0022568686|nr:ABC transporter I family member 11, chloroplastic isoform X2 [Diospyros lotus]